MESGDDGGDGRVMREKSDRQMMMKEIDDGDGKRG